MKKTIIILAVAMTALFCITLAGCGGSNGGDTSDSPYLGTWNAVSMSIGDESEPFDDTCILTLNDDGTGTLEDGEGEGEVTEFTWEPTEEGLKTAGDMKMKFVDNGDGTISGKILGANLNFEKQ